MLDAAPRSTPPTKPPRPSTLDEELWAAGVYFRRPGAPPRPTSMPPGALQGYGAGVSSGVKENGGVESYTEENERNEAYRDGRMSDSSYVEENALNASYGKENANLEAYSEENAKYMPYRVSRVIRPLYSEEESGKLKSRSEGAAKLESYVAESGKLKSHSWESAKPESYVGQSGKLKSHSWESAKLESYVGENAKFKSYSGETSKYQPYRESKVTTSSYSENKTRNFAIMKSAVPERDLDLEESVLRELDSSLAGLSGSESTSNSSTPSGGSVRGRGVMGGRGGGTTTNTTPPPESFNLIEEVMVETRSAPLLPPPSPPPPSTVTIRAYYQYPSVPPVPPPPQDSDSGHESGATSPCGTLTGEDGTAEDSNHPALSSPQHPHQGLGVGVSVVGGDPGCVGVGGVCLEPRPPTHFVVVAIDFGTTYSGYAFSFTSDPDSVHMMKQWQGGDPGVLNQKTPTTLLLTPDQRFHSLGYQARDTYHDLDPSEAPHWLYFDKFKMVLHSEESLNLDTQIEAANGKRLPAIRVFSHALRYFRDHALRELSDQGVGGGGGGVVGVLEEDVRWVITVPAIWSHPAKQFMRTAAYEAGMGSPNRPDQLLIALEPEVAAIYCRRLRRHQLLPPPPAAPPSARPLPPHLQDDPVPPPPSPDLDRDTVYAVVDCGGGTVDITVHQMTDRTCGHLKELHKATGGPHGSTGVDDEFVQLLVTIFGGDFMTCFKRQRPAAFVDLMIAFEARKRNASPRRSAPLNIALPFSFIDLYRKLKGKDVESAVRKHQHLGVRWSSQGMLRLDPEAMHRLFLPTLISITEAIEGVLASPEVRALQYMFLVGGFAESEVLQKHIRDAFSHRVRVVIPQGTGLAILRGAVQFGLDPGIVTVRRSRLTYGVGVLNRFNPAEHPREKRVTAAGGEWCADVLDRFVGVDESVAVGDVVVRSYTPATPKQSTVILHLYATERHDVKFVTEPGVDRVGTLHLDLGPPSSTTSTTPPSREISVHMRFGDTEVKASAVDHLTGHCVKADIDFLTL
ncbi:heat shock 70 kDa protein 12A-like isoform X2 [Eriocheir sinensis]|uniref:heat shock 70 kDa protein 12A-like isoform X2 n=1 Tax=Eriocheir sinensis TaxID=95602 RepID=UPI0021C71479|nr:heat shock 70 kDa protein 12A-like isoform X2 [Eriocheir sinensis]